jgi:hypothetical protein
VLTGQSLTAVAEENPPRRTKGETAAKTGATAALPDAPGDAPADQERPTVPELAELIVPAIRECAQADGWAYLSSVGAYVVNNEPSFDSRNYGYARLGQLVGALPFVEVKDVPDQNDFPHRWVRLRPDAPE